MKNNSRLILALIVAGLPSAAFPQALQCTDIARTLKEFSISTSSSSYLNSVFDSYCEASGNTKTSSGSLGLEAVVKAIPIKFTGSASNSEEAMKNFCKNYAGTTALQERKFSYEERIASKALDTVTDCLRLQAQGVTITHDIVNRDTSAFFLKSSVEQKITLSGVSVNGPVACTGQISGKNAAFNQSTNVIVSKSQNFTCTRTPEMNAQKVKVYPESSIVISTNFGNYNVLWPRDEQLPEDMASAIGRDIELAKGQIGALTNQAATNDGRYVKINDASYLKSQDKVKLYGRPGTNECIFSFGGNGGAVVTGDCGNNAANWQIAK